MWCADCKKHLIRAPWWMYPPWQRTYFAQYGTDCPFQVGSPCPHGDSGCPCPDGLACHYEGPDAWPKPEGQREAQSVDTPTDNPA